MPEPGRGGDPGECIEELTGLRKTIRDSYLFQISGAGLDGIRPQLSGGSGEPKEYVEELGTSNEDPGTGGC